MLFSLLVPALPPLVDAPVTPPMIVAQAAVKSDMSLSACDWVQSPDHPNGSLGGQLAPASVLQNYWYNKYKEVMSIKDAKVTIFDAPKHGTIEGQWLSKTDGPYFAYLANSGFLGKDKITFLVEVGGKRVKVVMTLIVDKSNLDQGDSPCPSGLPKRISSIDAPNTTADLAAWLSTTQWGGKLANAANHNGYIDTTPWDSSEFLTRTGRYHCFLAGGNLRRYAASNESYRFTNSCTNTA